MLISFMKNSTIYCIHENTRDSLYIYAYPILYISDSLAEILPTPSSRGVSTKKKGGGLGYLSELLDERGSGHISTMGRKWCMGQWLIYNV